MTRSTALKWIARVGYLLVALGIALLSPLSDFLPVEGWQIFKRSEHGYRIVPGEENWTLDVSLIGVGLLFIAPSLFQRSRRR